MSSDDGQDVVAWVRGRMAERGMSQRRLGHLSGVDHSTISRLLRDGRPPTLRTVSRLVEALGVSRGGVRVPCSLEIGPRDATDPVVRVEQALRADPMLGPAEVRRLLEQYRAARAGLVPCPPGEG